MLEGELRGRLRATWQARFTAIAEDELVLSLDFTGVALAIHWTRLAMRAEPEARIFWLGQQLTHVDLRGRRGPVLSQEPGIGRGIQPLTFVMNALFGAGGTPEHSNAPAPFLLTSRGRAFFLDRTELSIFDFRDPRRTRVKRSTRRPSFTIQPTKAWPDGRSPPGAV